MTKKIKVEYFPRMLVLVTPSALFLGGYFYYSNYPLTGLIIGLLGLLTGILTLTTFYVTEFDFEKHIYRDYFSMLGLWLNYKKKEFKNAEKLVIIRGRHQHTVRFPGAQPYLVNWNEFTAILLLDDDELELMTKKSKRKLIRDIRGIADFFKIDIEDKSVKDPYLIDLKRFV